MRPFTQVPWPAGAVFWVPDAGFFTVVWCLVAVLVDAPFFAGVLVEPAFLLDTAFFLAFVVVVRFLTGVCPWRREEVACSGTVTAAGSTSSPLESADVASVELADAGFPAKAEAGQRPLVPSVPACSSLLIIC